MAKKKKQEEVYMFEEIQLPIEPTPTPEVVEPAVDNSIVMKVENLRAKGFDDNRIAATLMIHKHIVESI